MSAILRRRLAGSRGTIASTLSPRCQLREVSLVRMLARPPLRLLHSSFPSRTSPPAQATDAPGPVAIDAGAQARVLEKELLRIMSDPRPNNLSLVALMRAWMQLGEQPSLEVVRVVAGHFSLSKDVQSSKAVLSLLERATSSLAAAIGGPATDDSVGVMFRSLIVAHCRRQDIPGALAEIEEMDKKTGGGRGADAKVFLLVLKACVNPGPPLLEEAEHVWAQVEDRGLLANGGVEQALFTTRMNAYANSAGYASNGGSQEEVHQAVLHKMDGAWDDLLKALTDCAPAGASDSSEEAQGVTTKSWMARAAALALCARDSGAASDSAMSRSLDALRSYVRSGGSFRDSNDIFSLAEVVRGLARCGRQGEVAALLVDLLHAAETPEESSAVTKVTTTAAGAAIDKARTRTAAAEAARVSEGLLRALRTRGRGLDNSRAYGLSLLAVVEEVAAEAVACGKRTPGGVDSRLTATLQAILAASHLLGSEDAVVINAAACRAMDVARASTAAAAAAAATTVVDGGGAESAGGGDLVGVEEWPGPNLAALTLFTLLHVSKQPREGIPVAIDALQEMHDRGMSPPSSAAAQLDVIFKRYGSARQKRRGAFLLARALDGYGAAVDDESEGGETGSTERSGAAAAGNTEEEDAPGTAGLGDAIRDMVKNAVTRGENEWNPEENPTDGEGSACAGDAADGDSSSSSLSVAQSYQLLRRRMGGGGMVTPPPSVAPGVGGVERACAAAAEARREGGGEERRRRPEEATHGDVLQRVTVLAERGRAHAALAALQEVDGRKRGSRVDVPYKVYALLFRALSNGYAARAREELELAASPMESLQWLLRGMARQGYSPGPALLNFGLEAFAVAATSRKVRNGGEEARVRVCTEAMDFMEAVRDGWNGLHPPVPPDLVSFNIIIKIMCRLEMFDQAFEVLEVMERGGHGPNRITYSTLIHGLSKAGDNNTAWEVMLAMTNKGIKPHSIVIDGIVDGFVRSGDVGEAISFAQHAFNQYGCPPTAEKFCRVVHAALTLDDGQHEARRAVIVAEQLWKDDWRGEGKSSHPVLGHPNLKELLRDGGVLEHANRL